MTLQNIPLLQAMGAKMQYLSMRQDVLAQNIANADTPKYRARDLTKVDFGSVLEDVIDSDRVRMEKTHPGHMPSPDVTKSSKNQKQKITYEVAPAGNAVIVEEQMVKATQTTMDFNLMTNLMRKQTGMIRIALGRGQ
ncbi:MAG: flagellar basal body rod protein FlgB [Rhodospirillales bacterium]|nr:flagellar basal body rod protein FlgB [Alphaproteobacteria bacterium]USO02975.1 MAG: flagellar basal body rod protein FlgB [Rhodospirillales bacterium]